MRSSEGQKGGSGWQRKLDLIAAEGAPAVVYVRVSPGKGQAAKADEPDGYSLPAQLEACKRKAASLKAVVIEEFIERSESAKTADRPELQRMLQFVKDNRVKYVIVHKVDRLARNRADDVRHQPGAPAGRGDTGVRLREHRPDAIRSAAARHHVVRSPSSTAATWRRRSSRAASQKAKNGGTPGKAPLGYLNVRQIVNGLEGRTVEVDPERGAADAVGL